jgi:hypothetical protein
MHFAPLGIDHDATVPDRTPGQIIDMPRYHRMKFTPRFDEATIVFSCWRGARKISS